MKWLVLATLVLVACGDDDATMDAGTDSGMPDTAMPDTSMPDTAMPDVPTDAGPVACDVLSETVPFLLAPGLRQTQLHPAAAFDGERMWVSLTVDEEEGSAFDIVLLSLDCGGNVIGDPIAVTQAVEPNDIDGAIALGSESLVLAWQRDEGTGTITTWTRTFELDGTARDDEQMYASMREGEVLDTTVWFPELQARDGGFWLSGLRGIEGVGFQFYAQQLDHDGAAFAGDALEPAPSMADQTGGSLLAVGSELHFTWSETIDDNDQAVYLAPGETDPVLLQEGFVASNAGRLVAHGDSIVAGVRVGTANGTARLMQVGSVDSTDIATGSVGVPYVEAGEGDRGAVLWTDDQSGFTADALWVAAYTAGDPPTLDTPREINTLGSVGLPYAPSVTHLSGAFYLVTWTEREGEVWQSWGQIIEL